MSGTEDAIKLIKRTIGERVAKVAPYRAVVTAVDGGLLTIRRQGATTADTRKVPSCGRFVFAANDEVLVVNMDGEPIVIDRINRASAASPSVAALAAAGSTATISVTGTDSDGAITLTPNGTGIAAGAIFELTFAVARPNTNYSFIPALSSGAARTLGMKIGRSARTSGKVTVSTDTALTGGSTYVFDYAIRQYG